MGKTKKEITAQLKKELKTVTKSFADTISYQQALKEARGGGSIESKPPTFLKKFDYDIIYKNGIYRKKGGKTVHLTKNEAVREQIKSIKKFASKDYEKNNFISNYRKALDGVGYSEYAINKVSKMLKNVSSEKLAYLIEKGILPDIQFIYAEEEEQADFLKDITNAIEKGISNEKMDSIVSKAYQLQKNIKERNKIMGYLK